METAEPFRLKVFKTNLMQYKLFLEDKSTTDALNSFYITGSFIKTIDDFPLDIM